MKSREISLYLNFQVFIQVDQNFMTQKRWKLYNL